ncbi:DUF5704 domain-containing protein [Paenibacillus taichungensis]|uniref:DUF5704 domain-containing protein n=1 Tax=Paenibacillus taichungensis TaxID=484184 RepID=UPI0035DF52E2
MKITKWLTTLSIILFSISISRIVYADFGTDPANPYPTTDIEKLVPTDANGKSKGRQKIKVKVQGMDKPRPKIVWTQGDYEIWQATGESPNSRVETNTHWVGQGLNKRGFPLLKEFTDTIDVLRYSPDSLKDGADNPFNRNFINDLGISDMTYISADSYEVERGSKPVFTVGGTKARIAVKTGYPLTPTGGQEYGGTRPDGIRKWQLDYETPMEIFFYGHVYEEKQIKVSSSATMEKNETKQLSAEIRTIDYKGNESAWTNVSTRSQTEWKTNSESVATVDSNGVVTAQGEGTATITALWKPYENGQPYYIWESVTITVGEGGGDHEPTGPTCTRPEPGRVLEGKHMDPAATGVIKADSRGSELFDVLKGIPTSESLYGNVFSKDYLSQNKFVEMSGTCTYTVTVVQNWTLTWKDPRTVSTPGGGTTTVYDIPRSESDVRRPQYRVVRPYSYWTIDELSVYNILQATLKQYAFSGDQITIYPSGYQPPDFQAQRTGKFYPANDPSPVSGPSRSKDGGTSRPSMDEENLQSVAEAAVPDVQVENDSLIFKGQTIMDKQRVAKRGPQPGNIPAPGEIGKDVLYSPNNVIPSSKVNKKDEVSTGTIEFIKAAGSINTNQERLIYDINGLNTVTVHTPVVNYSAVSDDQPHNQKTKPNMSRSALILERPFTVRIPTSGQHLDVSQYPGYGNRDYAKYFRTKQVRFMFDVYNGSRSQFIPANTWIDIPVNQLDTEFYLPVWVDEGDYQVYFRNIAENAPEGYSWQSDANLDLANHAAVDEVSVEVIGRLYDFHITDIADYNWERVFRTFAGSKDPSGTSYWVGQNGIDGDPRGNLAQFTLPIRPGSNPLTGMGNVSVKTGYHFKFDFKTKGNMFSKQDGIRITPTFTYVSKAGGTPIPVDLYYKTNEKPFVKIGSAEDTVQRYVILNERLRNVPLGDMKNSGYWKYDQHLTAAEKIGVDREEFMRNYVLKYTKLKTPVGGYDKLILPEQLKTLIGSKEIPSNASVTPERANASIQQWYGEYSIPAAPYVVPAGTNLAEYGRTNGGLTDKSPIFMKDGYIVVNFDIESIQNGKVNDPHLQYIHAPLMNQWKLEGYRNSILDSFMKRYNVKDGDVVFYNADKSSYDDLSSQAPH